MKKRTCKLSAFLISALVFLGGCRDTGNSGDVVERDFDFAAGQLALAISEAEKIAEAAPAERQLFSPRTVDKESKLIITSSRDWTSGFFPGELWCGRADRIVENLSGGYLAPVGGAHGFLLLHSTGSKAGNSEIDVPLVYADYYFLEALLRKHKLETTGKI